MTDKPSQATGYRTWPYRSSGENVAKVDECLHRCKIHLDMALETDGASGQRAAAFQLMIQTIGQMHKPDKVLLAIADDLAHLGMGAVPAKGRAKWASNAFISAVRALAYVNPGYSKHRDRVKEDFHAFMTALVGPGHCLDQLDLGNAMGKGVKDPEMAESDEDEPGYGEES